jgi:hypothetical protein
MPINPATAKTRDSILRETIYANVYHTALFGAGLYSMYRLVDKSNPAVPTYLMGAVFAERCINLISSISAYALMDTSELNFLERQEAQRQDPSDGVQAGSDAVDAIEASGAMVATTHSRTRIGSTPWPSRTADQATADRANHQGLLNRYNRMYKNLYNRGCLTLGTGIVIGTFGNEENRNSFWNLFPNANKE